MADWLELDGVAVSEHGELASTPSITGRVHLICCRTLSGRTDPELSIGQESPVVVNFLLGVVLHVLLLASMLGFCFSLYRLVVEVPEREESVLRTGMVVCALLVILTSGLVGLSVAEFTVDALSEANPLLITASAATPGGAGVAVGWYLTNRFRTSGNVAHRIMIFVGTITVVEFILVYSESITQEGLGLGPAVIPNISFVVGILLYVGFTHEGRQAVKGRPDKPNGNKGGRFIP